MRRTSIIAVVGIFAFVFGNAQAQYTADFQTNIISGVTSNWSGDYIVGSNTFADVLLIQGSGVLSNGNGYIGFETGGSNNSAIVAGSGSVWHNSGTLSMGYTNTLSIINGGRVNCARGAVGNIVGECKNNVLVSGSGSVWNVVSSFLDVGTLGSDNTLVISNGGQVFSSAAGIGFQANSSNNRVLVTGPGSTWSNVSPFIIGTQGSSNNLVIEHGAQVVSLGPGGSFVGDSSSGNSALVTGSGSVWRNGSTLRIGDKNLSANNRLVVSNGGQVVCLEGYLGSAYLGGGNGGKGSNSVEITGNGSLWKFQNGQFGSGILYVGSSSPGNSLIIKDNGAIVADRAIYVGQADFSASTCDNLLQLDSGSVAVTNSSANAVLEVRNGKVILNGGVLRADILVLTNDCARLIRNGGTLLYNQLVLDANLSAVGDGIPNGWKQQYGLDPFDPNLADADSDGDGFNNMQEFLAGTDPTNSASAFAITSVVQEQGGIRVKWKAGGGRTNVVQFATSLTGVYSNVSPNVILAGSGDVATNYLDGSILTNAPARFYKVRLVP